MIWFWESTIRPLFDAYRPRTIVEVGAAGGHTTTRILDWAAENDAVLHCVDPVPGFDVDAYQERHGNRFIFHRAKSHDVLGHITAPDVVLLDGDHNWWTVHGELTLIEERAERDRRPFPLTLMHDVSWPYGRRDMYYAPEDVPKEFRHPHRKASIVFGQSALSMESGINGGVFNAETEGTPRNGVLTAAEDFLAESSDRFRFEVLPGFSGLGIIAGDKLLAKQPALAERIDWLSSVEYLQAHAQRLETGMARAGIAAAEAKRSLRRANLRVAELERQLERARPVSAQIEAPT